MPYVPPATVVTGTTITSPWGNSVKAATDYLANPPTCRVYRTAVQAVVSATITPILFTSERWDTDTMHDNVTNPSRITIKTAGVYVVTAAYGWAPHATGVREEWIEINNSGIRLVDSMLLGASGTYGHRGSITTIHKFAVNDYIEFRVYHDAGVNLDIQALNWYSPEFSAVWVGIG